MSRGDMPPGLWDMVVRMDGGCVAPVIDAEAGPCRDFRGFVRPRHLDAILTVDHVRGQPPIGQLQVTKEGGYGKRAPSDPEHLATLCRGHHLDSGWATSHRPELRAYIAERNARYAA